MAATFSRVLQHADTGDKGNGIGNEICLNQQVFDGQKDWIYYFLLNYLEGIKILSIFVAVRNYVNELHNLIA